jgi:excisionase family DNA binding protein
LIDSDGALLKYAARVLGDLRRRYRLNGLHWPPELESLRLLVASEGQARPILDFDADPGDSLAMTYEEAARKLAVSSRTVRRLVASGELPRVDIGGCSRIATADLEAFAEGLRRERTPAS